MVMFSDVSGNYIFAVRRSLAKISAMAIVHDEEMPLVSDGWNYGDSAERVAWRIVNYRTKRSAHVKTEA